jgi:TatA/E family protein of Tat protein translocase
MFGIGPMELLVCGCILMLLFGNRLPNILKTLGQSVKAFKEETK